MSHDSPLRLEQDTELVIGLVGAVGTDLNFVADIISGILKKYNYQAERIHLSDVLTRLDGLNVDTSSEFRRVDTSMTAGNSLRESLGRNDVLALYAVSAIFGSRRVDSDIQGPFQRKAFILKSVKRPEEVNTLRQIYGHGFFLIGVYASEQVRSDYLRSIGISNGELTHLMKRDEDEDAEFGQKTRDTFQLADVFVRLNPAATSHQEMERFFDLIFGCPHRTPAEEEQAMFLAYSSALRSGDLSRQVGAVIVSPSGDIIGLGANDVPRPGGGLCWPGGNDVRDHVRGFDSNEKARNQLLKQIVDISVDELQQIATRKGVALDGLVEILAEFKQAATASNKSFKKAELFDITEYGRAVHAEMEAILACARTGRSTLGCTLFVTTFPCHNCAKHIIDAGIRRVIYIEPYPKSRTENLYPESIDMDDEDRAGAEYRADMGLDAHPVRFTPFFGIGPRRYIDLFSMTLGSGYPLIRKARGVKSAWRPASAQPRIPMPSASYLQREHQVSKWLLERSQPSSSAEVGDRIEDA